MGCVINSSVWSQKQPKTLYKRSDVWERNGKDQNLSLLLPLCIAKWKFWFNHVERTVDYKRVSCPAGKFPRAAQRSNFQLFLTMMRVDVDLCLPRVSLLWVSPPLNPLTYLDLVASSVVTASEHNLTLFSAKSLFWPWPCQISWPFRCNLFFRVIKVEADWLGEVGKNYVIISHSSDTN